jgi:hypothetical protein
MFVAGLILAGSAVLSHSAHAQSNAVQSPAASIESSPIGKVVTASGSVTIEHANAVVVQAALPAPGGVGQTKAGDLVYKGDVVRPAGWQGRHYLHRRHRVQSFGKPAWY